MYYLNHVGYKVQTVPWGKEDMVQYYLNHVGYKDCKRKNRKDICKSSIIWTMWDIKSELEATLRVAKTSIIWTMWDIKNKAVSLIYPHLNVLSEPCGI